MAELTNKPRGRPRAKIEKEAFEKLCALQCTKHEIASFFNVSEDTIENWCHREYNENFSAIFSKKRETGKISLRRSQFKLAEKNATMAIFLGKQYLDQKEKPWNDEVNLENTLGNFFDALSDVVKNSNTPSGGDEDVAE